MRADHNNGEESVTNNQPITDADNIITPPLDWASLIVEGIEEAIFSLDSAWHFTYLNKQAAQVWNRSKEGLLGKILWEEFPTVQDTSFEKLLRLAMGNGQSTRLEDFFSTSQSWYDIRIYPIPQGLIIYFQNITERKQMELALQRDEERFKVLSKAAFEGVVIHQNGIIVEANQNAAKMLGYNRVEEVIGQSIIPMVAPESLAEVRKRIAEGSEEVYEAIAVRKDGTRFPIEGQGKSIEYQGRIFRVIVLRDITDRKFQAQQLQESEERYKFLSDATFEGIIAYQDRIVVEANESAVRLTGCASPEELIGTRASQWAALDSIEAIQQRAAENYDKAYETVMLKKDGTPFQAEVRGKTLEYRGHNVRVVTIRDITELKQAEEALRKTQAQLLQAQKMESIGRLAGGIAHDFNNLLTAIIGSSELIILNLGEENSLYGYASEIKNAALRAASLTRQLLAFSRQQVLQPKVCNLNKIVADVDKLLHRLIGEDIELLSLLEPELGEVLADPGQIEQVILNLAVNARDAMPDGGKLTIETANAELNERYRVEGHPEIKTGSYVMLAVSDTGMGMDPATQQKIFEPFFTTKETGKGTGLGLATVYGIVEQSEGYIFVYSEIGVGSTFKIYLPRIKSRPEEVEDDLASPGENASHETGSRLGSSQNGKPGKNRTVLVVEDDELVRTLIYQVLGGAGYNILGAINGQEALELLVNESDQIDLVLTDIIMPKMGGRELLEYLKARWPDLKVICMSGYTDQAVVRHDLLQQCDNFLQKPFTPSVLLSLVEAALRV
jgi:PAS domain S-box-containing protein